jgi:hypothetical protein
MHLILQALVEALLAQLQVPSGVQWGQQQQRWHRFSQWVRTQLVPGGGPQLLLLLLQAVVVVTWVCCCSCYTSSW